MQNWLFILVNVCVAAFVGGVTNHFAIKMLFHPREEKIILGRRVPFTPGLIPKRKDEIAESLGHVVSDYLVTSEGLQDLIRRPVFRSKMEESPAEAGGMERIGAELRRFGAESMESRTVGADEGPGGTIGARAYGPRCRCHMARVWA